MKKSGVFWGISLIGTAILLLVSYLGTSLGFLDISGVPIVRICLGVLCLAWLISALVRLKISEIFFPLAFIFLLFEKKIAGFIGAKTDELIPTWIVILCAFLLTIGVGTLFPKKEKTHPAENAQKIGVDEKSRMGHFVKYIDCNNFTDARIDNSMGECEVFFENTQNYQGGGTLYVTNNLGAVTVRVPADWKIITDFENGLGDVSVPSGGGEKTLRISGKNNLGSVNVVRE